MFGMQSDAALIERAEERACEVRKEFSHKGFEKSLTGTGYKVLGENLAKGYKSDFERMSAFINSPTHLANLQKGYTHFGVGRCGYYMAVLMAK